MNKRQMYNRIMESVAKEVKKALLNEDINNDIIERLPTEEELVAAFTGAYISLGSYGECIIYSDNGKVLGPYLNEYGDGKIWYNNDGELGICEISRGYNLKEGDPFDADFDTDDEDYEDNEYSDGDFELNYNFYEYDPSDEDDDVALMTIDSKSMNFSDGINGINIPNTNLYLTNASSCQSDDYVTAEEAMKYM